jgi:hypothetical protein
MKPDKLPPKLSKPDKSPLEVVWDGGFATVTVVLDFSFLFILVETLKNYRNHKIKN